MSLVQSTKESVILVNDMIQERLVHEVHTSERKSYRGCRRRWHWVFQEFYYPQVTAKPLEFGVAFHEAMEVYYDPITWKWDRDVVLNASIGQFVNTCNKQKTKFIKNNLDESFLTEEQVEEEYQSRIELGSGMLHYFHEKVASIHDKGWTPLKVEIEFIAPIQDPDNGNFIFCTCNRCRRTQELRWKELGFNYTLELVNNEWNVIQYGPEGREIQFHEWNGLPVCLAGRIDALMEDAHGRLFIVDWKTAARLSRGDASGQDHDEFLENDDQIGSYVMALVRKLGIDVKGFVYVELKKAFPAPPIKNSSRRLGRLFSVNKQQAVSYDSYLETIKNEDAEAYKAGLYDEFLEYLQLSGERFHGRYQILKTAEELVEIERNLFWEAAEMCNQNTKIYPSPGRFNCATCAFRQPCLEKNRGGDYQTILDTMFDRRKEHYWVKELSTDKQRNE